MACVPLGYMTKLAILLFGAVWVASCIYIYAPFFPDRNSDFEWLLSALTGNVALVAL